MATYTVGYDSAGSALDYTTISAAQSAASGGDTLETYYSNATQGLYWGETLTITKNLSLINMLDQIVTVYRLSHGFQCSGTTTWSGYRFTPNNGGYSLQVNCSSSSSGTFVLDRCIFSHGFYFATGNGAVIQVDSCLGIGNSGYAFLVAGGEIGNATFNNCTAIGGSFRGFRYATCYNCLAMGNASQGFSVCTGDYNCSYDSTAPGANSIEYKPSALNFGDPATHWFYVADYDSPLAGAGSATYSPTHDLIGGSFAATPSIGCYAAKFVNTDRDSALDSVTGGNWTIADRTKVQEGNDFGVSGSEVATLDNDNILSTVTDGNWYDIPEADVKLGENWGVGGSSRTGTYNPAAASVVVEIQEDQIYWTPNDDGVMVPRAQSLDLNYPTEQQTQQGVVYGYLNQYTGQLNASGGGVIPNAAIISVQDNQDGISATVTVRESETDVSNRIYVFRRNRGIMELVLATTIVGNGSDTFNGAVGEYIAFSVPESDDSLYGIPSDPDSFWISNSTDYNVRDQVAEVAESVLSTLIVSGIQVKFTNVDEPEVEIWASLDGGSGVTQLKRSAETDTTALQFTIPRQTDFPPSEFKPGAFITYDSIDYEINSVEYSNGLPELSAAFIIRVDRFNQETNY